MTTIKDIMTADVDIIAPDTTIDQAARKMRDDDVGARPVGEDGRLIGMITDRDICCRAVAESKSPKDCTVREAMSERIAWIFEDESPEAAARQMAECQIRRLAVLNRDKRLVGIVSMGDLARHGLDDDEALAIRGVARETGEARHMH